jgi:hypothetical protein
MAVTECCNNPRFFFCECIGVEAEGTVSVIMACTSCGTAKATKIHVAQGASPLRLLREEKQKG